ncbi:MAG TPA: hypothetical protein VHC42_07070 [Rhizomicrobium sp.]|jgi:hypothetical protein|nr:hypothetical protein [Rhizomicrobium sp.]
MRIFWIGPAALAASLTAAPALAQAPAATGPVTAKLAAPAEQSEPLPDLAPGDDVAISCDAIERVADPSDVRVVFTIAAAPGDTSPGYKKILAIDEKVAGGAVHLKVPNAPDLPNHTVDLAVYVIDGAKNNDCDGGSYRIVQTPAPATPHDPG